MKSSFDIRATLRSKRALDEWPSSDNTQYLDQITQLQSTTKERKQSKGRQGKNSSSFKKAQTALTIEDYFALFKVNGKTQPQVDGLFSQTKHKPIKRPNRPFVTSEKTLANYAESNAGIKMVFNLDKEDDESSSVNDDIDDGELWPSVTEVARKKKQTDLKKQSVQSEILAARQSRGWQDFVKTGSVAFGYTEEDKSKRVRRMLMVGQAINAYEDVPIQEPGQRFLQNSWGQGPFYAWENNYLNRRKSDNTFD